MNILLVEDDEILAEATAKIIECISGHQVTVTEAPSDVFRYCESGAVDLVMMDVNLPGAHWEGEEVSGADLARLLKTQPHTAPIPIILVTAYAMEAEKNSLLNISHADAFCAKPIADYEKLLDLMMRLVQMNGTTARLQSSMGTGELGTFG